MSELKDLTSVALSVYRRLLAEQTDPKSNYPEDPLPGHVPALLVGDITLSTFVLTKSSLMASSFKYTTAPSEEFPSIPSSIVQLSNLLQNP